MQRGYVSGALGTGSEAQGQVGVQDFPLPTVLYPGGLGGPRVLSKWSRTLLSYVTSPICPYFYNLEKGSSSCKMRPACTDKDYFYTHTACDANGEVGSTVWERFAPR